MSNSLHQVGSLVDIEDEVSPFLSVQRDDLEIESSPERTTTKKATPVEDERALINSVRKPVHYHSINADVNYDDQTRAAINRYKYYSKLAPHNQSLFMMPEHVVPIQFFVAVPTEQAGEQSSIVTIFSLWNTMLGSSLLSMPWALGQAGFGLGMVMFIVMGAITLYTSYRIMKSTDAIVAKGEIVEFSDVCLHYLGRPGEYAAVFFSLSAFLGAMIVYWVLISNFLYSTVSFIYDKSSETATGNDTLHGATCPSQLKPHPAHNGTGFMIDHTQFTSSHAHSSEYKAVWDQYKTVPLFLCLVLLPLMSIKSPTFFTRFNALGTISVIYLFIFISVKASQWGINIDFHSIDQSPYYVPQAKSSFVAFTGTLSLAFYIHNAVVTIVRNQKHPENNGRDLTIAYVCVLVTYMFVGTVFYVSLPFPKDCIGDNLLDNFLHTDLMSFVSRLFLFMQMVTVFPLLAYIFRVQFMHSVFGKVFPSWKHVIFLNLVLTSVCLIFARFLPNIGEIISFTGAFCGLAYVFTLPCLVYMMSLRDKGTLTMKTTVLHVTLIVLGVANFIGQIIRQAT